MKKINQYDLSNDICIGYAGNTNNPFYFDKEDYEIIKNYYWFEHHNGYIVSVHDSTTIFMHRLIYNDDTAEEVDHKDRNKKNNCKDNLRPCNHIQNNQNRNVQSNNTSGVIGVYFDKQTKKWRAQIKINKKQKSLGRFYLKEDAIKARLEAELKYFGDFAPQKHLYHKYNIQIKNIETTME